jgi:hypothetical protein
MRSDKHHGSYAARVPNRWSPAIKRIGHAAMETVHSAKFIRPLSVDVGG